MSPPATGSPILVTGAAGKTGRAVIRALTSKNVPTRAFVRRAKYRDAVERLGAGQVVEGDLRGRETVAAAVSGVEAIYHICPNVHPDEVGIGRRVISAAMTAGVRRIVYHSVLHPQIEAMPHHWGKLRVEEVLFESGLDYSILQPAPYMQNVLGQWRSMAGSTVYPVPYNLDTRVAMVDLEDIAEVAARVLTEVGHNGATYELCGPDQLDQHEIAAILGRGLGKNVHAQAMPRHEWTEGAKAAGLGDYQIETLLSMFRYYERSGMAGGPRVLRCLLGRAPTSFEDFVARTIAGPA
jgi:uncharacterized protein YbjT (DUF2867 family)